MFFWMALWVLFLGALLWGIVYFFMRRPTRPIEESWRIQPGEPSALEILNRRYARGELDPGTYEEMCVRIEASANTKGPPITAGR